MSEPIDLRASRNCSLACILLHAAAYLCLAKQMGVPAPSGRPYQRPLIGGQKSANRSREHKERLAILGLSEETNTSHTDRQIASKLVEMERHDTN